MVTFILKEPESEYNTLIFLTYYYSGNRFKYSTGWQICPDDWNAEKQQARSSYPHQQELNSYLIRVTREVSGIHLRLIAEGVTPTTNQIRDELNRILHRGGKRGETFLEYIDRFILTCRKGKVSIGKFRTVRDYIKGFQGVKNFQDINTEWLNAFVGYMESKGRSANYIGKTIAIVKQFLNEAAEDGVNKYTAYKSRRFAAPHETADTIYLTVTELITMYEAKLPSYLRKVCDRYMIGSFTALRFSDFSRIRTDHIQEGMLYIMQEKVNEPVVIPIHYIVREIFDRYNGQLPNPISNQRMNDYLKLVGKRAGIEQVIVKRRTKGGVRTEKAFKKWELITTHTARRSAATNMYLAGIPTLSIMKITGHKTEKSFLSYIRISQEENARLIASHSFFQRPVEK